MQVNYTSWPYSVFYSDMLKLGSSVPWPEAMEKLTGRRKMDAGPLLEYFKPLLDWLEKENYHERQGWSMACPTHEQMAQKSHQVSCYTSGTTRTMIDLTLLFVIMLSFFIRHIV